MISEAAQLVFPGFKFGIDDPADAFSFVELGVGGFCLYGGEAAEVRELTSALQKRARSPLLFCADYEDGVASQSLGGTWLASNMGLGAAGSEALAFEKGAVTAAEARALGVRWVLAPVVDLATAAANPIVNVRAFGRDPREVTRLARAYLRGLKSQGALSCLKHFPGHGETTADSHLELPSVGASRELLESRELVPFRELAAEAETVMTGHLRVPALEKDERIPISLSRAAVQETLRRELGFKGLVSSDALSMHAIAHNFNEIDAAALVLKGGSDILLVPANPRALIYGLLERVQSETALGAAVEAALGRLNNVRQAPAEPDFSIVGCAKHRETAKRMAEAAIAWAGESLAEPLSSFNYIEPDADGPEEWQGKKFISALRTLGGLIEEKADTALIGCFLRPTAYSGRIRYEDELIGQIKKRISQARRVVVVSFGSPFVLGQFGDVDAGLCAFAADEFSQEAAARVLSGQAAARGKMPVSTAGTAS